MYILIGNIDGRMFTHRAESRQAIEAAMPVYWAFPNLDAHRPYAGLNVRGYSPTRTGGWMSVEWIAD